MPRHRSFTTMGLLMILAGLGLESAMAPAAPAGGQNPSSPAVANPPVVIKTESNLVQVDVIATDKKGNYIKDLEKDDFHVFEDGAEQPVTFFSREADVGPNAPGHQRFLVLFFDDSTMNAKLQMQAREVAGKFVESTASANRQIAVVDFNGVSRIAQNFTADGDLLKRAVSAVKYSSVNPNAGGGNVQLAVMGTPSLRQTESDFDARSVLQSVREVAKSLRNVPGRKTLVMFSTGFALTLDRQSEVTLTIDALNKSNIAVYPVDVRGLTDSNAPGSDASKRSGGSNGLPPGSELRIPESPFRHLPGLLAALGAPPLPEPQRGGGGSGTGTGTRGGGGTGSSGGSSSNYPGSNTNNPNTQTNNINNLNNSITGCMSSTGLGGTQDPNCVNQQNMPQIPDSISTNQEVLYALAKGTGGFEIFNTNDFLSGLQKVAKEMSEYYNLGYTPPSQMHDGSYHKIRVKVRRSGVVVRYRTGYYDVKSPDMLNGRPEGKVLEERAASPQAGEIPVSLTAPYFYVEPGVARVNMALSVPGSSIDFEKQKGAFHSDVDVLGIAYRQNGSVAARFSDKVKLDYEKKTDLKDFAKGSFDYQNSFNIAPGSYTLKLVLSVGGEKFGKYEIPLVVEPFSGNELSLGGPALGEKFVPVSQAAGKMDAALVEERAPLVYRGLELVPSTSCRFAKGTQPVAYVEVYDPALKKRPTPQVGVMVSIFDRKTNHKLYYSGTIVINQASRPGNPLVPVGLRLQSGGLKPGDYRVEITGRDAVGNTSTARSADFSIE